MLCMCVADGREDGVRRDTADGGHGAVLRGAAGGHEEALGGRRSPGVLRPLQRVPAQRFCQIVSTTHFMGCSQKGTRAECALMQRPESTRAGGDSSGTIRDVSEICPALPFWRRQ